jgi:hypothetical protein
VIGFKAGRGNGGADRHFVLVWATLRQATFHGKEVRDAPQDKIDDAALALLYLTLHDGYRAWKGFDWDVLGRLHDKGMIGDPVGKVKSVVFAEEGLQRSKALFETMFKT